MTHRTLHPVLHSLLQALLAVLMAVLLTAATASAQQPDTSDQAVRTYMTALQVNLLQAQNNDGSWDYQGYSVGITALILQALLRSGLATDHPAVRKAATFIDNRTDGKTYSEGLVPCALELLDHDTYRERMQRSVKFLSEAQSGTGAWGYALHEGGFNGGDNSNTQFAVLGLAAAERAGVAIPRGVRQAAIQHWQRSHQRNGGWGYTAAGGRATFSMTCAGIASLEQLGLSLARRDDCCSGYEYVPEMTTGLDWLGRRLSKNPDQAVSGGRDLYALYALERVGIFLGLKTIGEIDWYRYGVDRILGQQLGQDSLSNMAFALLFLARGNAPIAIAKWEWSGDWNNQLYDLKTWTDVAGRQLDQRLDWLSAPLDSFDSPAAKASLLYLSGTDVFQVTDEELEVLRAFLDADGTLVAEATCDSLDFYDTFRATMLDRLCPEYNPRFEPLQPGHPLLSAHHDLTPGEVGGFRFQAGCKQYRIILLTRPIGCALNGDAASQPDRQRAEKVATNLLAWAFERRSARFKLDAVTLEPEEEGLSALTPDQIERLSSRRGRAYHQPFGRLRHPGQWLAAPRFFPVVQASLAERLHAPTFDAELYLSPASDDLYQCAVTWLTGYERPGLSEAEIVALRGYLQQGGFLLASAACTSQRFDEGFRQQVARLFPADQLEEIPTDDPIWHLVYPLDQLQAQGTEAYQDLYGDSWAPLYGIRRDGRWRLVYSPVDLCSDLGSPLHDAVPGYRTASAWPLVANILHYALAPL